jgi:hypothetical protein
VNQNRYQACVHIEPSVGAGPDENGLFRFTSAYQIAAPVCPAEVLGLFETPPLEVHGVSVSGVDKLVLRDEWIGCISQDLDHFDRPGKGHMRHPMFKLPEKFQHGNFQRLAAIRERSRIFN